MFNEALIALIEFVEEWEDMYEFYSDAHKEHWGFRPHWGTRPSIESMRLELFGFTNIH